jgi:hypothetical protein
VAEVLIRISRLVANCSPLNDFMEFKLRLFLLQGANLSNPVPQMLATVGLPLNGTLTILQSAEAINIYTR